MTTDQKIVLLLSEYKNAEKAGNTNFQLDILHQLTKQIDAARSEITPAAFAQLNAVECTLLLCLFTAAMTIKIASDSIEREQRLHESKKEPRR